jgi:hypothetical protein
VAQVVDAGTDQPLAEVAYGDAAEIRVTNLGRRGRANRNLLGFNLDLVKGRWLPEGPATEEDADDDFEADLADVQLRARVLPYVEDRRNIAILRWTEPLEEAAAITAQYALERGIEATFQLEDSELTSELLPDDAHRGRVLLVEAAEGGAGVLRRLQAEPDALPRAAAEALRIIHVDPDTGAEAADACVRGCYRCLLTYGNQLAHESIDRRTVIALLRSVAAGQTRTPEAEEVGEGTAAADLPAVEPGSRLAELMAAIAARRLAPPTALSTEVAGIHLDLLWADRHAAVVLDEPGHPPVDTFPLAMAGWNVISVPADADLTEVISANPSIFGQAHS